MAKAYLAITSSIANYDTYQNVTLTVSYYGNGVSFNHAACSGSLKFNGVTKTFTHSFTTSTSQQKLYTATFKVNKTTSTRSLKPTATFTTGVSLGTMSVTGTAISIKALASYSINFDANGGTGAPAKQIKYFGKTLTLSSTIPKRTDYTFLYWNTKNDGTGTKYTPGQSFTANVNLTLYAQWVRNKYKVDYSSADGWSKNTVVEYDSTTGNAIVNFPTRLDYTLDVDNFSALDIEPAENLVSFNTTAHTFVINGDVTVNTRWNINTLQFTMALEYQNIDGNYSINEVECEQTAYTIMTTEVYQQLINNLIPNPLGNLVQYDFNMLEADNLNQPLNSQFDENGQPIPLKFKITIPRKTFVVSFLNENGDMVDQYDSIYYGATIDFIDNPHFTNNDHTRFYCPFDDEGQYINLISDVKDNYIYTSGQWGERGTIIKIILDYGIVLGPKTVEYKYDYGTTKTWAAILGDDMERHVGNINYKFGGWLYNNQLIRADDIPSTGIIRSTRFTANWISNLQSPDTIQSAHTERSIIDTQADIELITTPATMETISDFEGNTYSLAGTYFMFVNQKTVNNNKQSYAALNSDKTLLISVIDEAQKSLMFTSEYSTPSQFILNTNNQNELIDSNGEIIDYDLTTVTSNWDENPIDYNGGLIYNVGLARLAKITINDTTTKWILFDIIEQQLDLATYIMDINYTGKQIGFGMAAPDDNDPDTGVIIHINGYIDCGVWE